MDNPLPFFYYDILSRIVPGAATLAVLWPTKGFAPMHWLHCFVTAESHEDWEKIAMPVLLLGLCYVIGVVFEVLDYFPEIGWFKGMTWVSQWIDRCAYSWTLKKIGDKYDGAICQALSEKGDDPIRMYGDELWQQLTFEGGSKPEMQPAFAHCHRFQAEQKMFLHLLYPTFLFEVLHLKDWWLDWQGPIGLLAFGLFAMGCRARSRRRWLQCLIFSKITTIRSEFIKAVLGASVPDSIDGHNIGSQRVGPPQE